MIDKMNYKIEEHKVALDEATFYVVNHELRTHLTKAYLLVYDVLAGETKNAEQKVEQQIKEFDSLMKRLFVKK